MARNTKSTRIWIIVAAVAGLLALAITTALLVVSFTKRRHARKQLEEARQRDPCLGQKEFSRRRRMTMEDLLHEAEEQRETMIHKSLASRSFRSESVSSRWTLDNTERPSVEGGGLGRICSLAEEKEVESGLLARPKHRHVVSLDETKHLGSQLERPSSAASNGSLRQHVQRQRGLSAGWSLPDFPAPTLSRSSSPSRSLLGTGAPEMWLQREPSLEQHPLFQQRN